MDRWRDDHELIIFGARSLAVIAELVEELQRVCHSEVIPGIDVQSGDIESIRVLHITKLIPPRIARFMTNESLPISGRTGSLIHHVQQRKGSPYLSIVNLRECRIDFEIFSVLQKDRAGRSR